MSGQVLRYHYLRSFRSALGHEDILASPIRREFDDDGLWPASIFMNGRVRGAFSMGAINALGADRYAQLIVA